MKFFKTSILLVILSLNSIAWAHKSAPTLNNRMSLPAESTAKYPYPKLNYTRIVVRQNFRVFNEAHYHKPRYRHMESIRVRENHPVMSNVFFKF